MELKGTAINFLGDSITEGSGTSEPGKRFTDILSSEYEIISFNYGIGGTRIARQATPSSEARFDLDFCSRVDELEPSSDAVVVFGGTNDFGHGDAPIGTPDDRTVDTFYGAMHVLCTKLIEKFPGKLIVFITPLHRLNEDSKNGDNKPYPIGNLYDYVKIIREVTEIYSIPVLDLFKESGMQPKIPVIKEMFMPDGLHPNDEGHKILAYKIAKFLERM